MVGTIYVGTKWHSDGAAQLYIETLTSLASGTDPHVERIGDISDEHLLSTVAGESQALRNRLFELLVWTGSVQELLQVKTYLETRLKRAVVSYRYPGGRTYFICRSPGEDGKALHFSPEQLQQLKASVASVLISARSEGDGAAGGQDTLLLIARNVERLFALYRDFESLQIVSIDPLDKTGTKGKLVLQTIDPRKPCLTQLDYATLQDFNSVRKESIYFEPIQESTFSRVLYLDDVPEARLTELPYNAIIVQTSLDSYQAHLPTAHGLTKRDVRQLQRHLAIAYGADQQCTDAAHPRRLPGYYNTKHSPAPLVRICDDITGGGPLLKWREVRQALQPDPIQTNAQPRLPYGKKPATRTWKYYERPDKSRADIRFALHLIGCGYGPDDIKAKLRKQSPDIETRKHDIDDYLERTVRKAHQYYREDYHRK